MKCTTVKYYYIKKTIHFHIRRPIYDRLTIGPSYPQVDGHSSRHHFICRVSSPSPILLELKWATKVFSAGMREGYRTELWLPIPKIVAISTGQ